MKKLLLGTALCLAAMTPAAMAQDVSVCLITKTDTNPFFVKMKEGAEAKAAELGVTLKSYAGRVDGDHETQVAAVETCIADGAKGILITASDTSAIVQSVQQARDAAACLRGESVLGQAGDEAMAKRSPCVRGQDHGKREQRRQPGGWAAQRRGGDGREGADAGHAGTVTDTPASLRLSPAVVGQRV